MSIQKPETKLCVCPKMETKICVSLKTETKNCVWKNRNNNLCPFTTGWRTTRPRGRWSSSPAIVVDLRVLSTGEEEQNRQVTINMLLRGQRCLQYGNKTLCLKKVDTTICVHTKAGNKTLCLSKNVAGSRRVLAAAVDNWSEYELTPMYNNARSHYRDSARLPPKKAFS